jgi:acyl-CoA synthetase (AMP-forming)/AMP-acid ligase II
LGKLKAKLINCTTISNQSTLQVSSHQNSSGYFTIYGDETDYNDHFTARLVTGSSTTEVWARTGYLGFLRRTECTEASSLLDETLPSAASRNIEQDYDQMYTQTGGAIPTTPASLSTGSGINQIGSIITPSTSLNNCSATANPQDSEHVAVYIVGALDEVISLRGMNYHPIDIENSVLRCHKKISECATFTWTNLLVVVAELDGNESEALDLVPLITSTILEEHQLIVGVVVVVDPGWSFPLYVEA